MEKIRIDKPIIVEGKYDKITLSSLLDATVLTLGGFSVFHEKEKTAMIRRVAEKDGVIVLTDSDGAGFVIRNFIKGCVDPKFVKHAYIPEIEGKEKRKSKASKEGQLGVEGMRPQVLLDALKRAGATFESIESTDTRPLISKADMYKMGLSGGEGSRAKREKLLRSLDLPQKLSADALLDVLNALMTREEFFALQL